MKLSLENCNLGDTGCISIMDGLERNGFLKELNLRKNNIRLEGAKRIGLLLSGQNVTLKSLNLSENKLGDIGGRFIAKAL